MTTPKPAYRIPCAVAALAATLAMSAHAEYRCATPQQLTRAEARACELARQDTPDALVRFVKETKAIDNLYFNDYVSNADVQRWDAARKEAVSDPIAAARTGSADKGIAKSH